MDSSSTTSRTAPQTASLKRRVYDFLGGETVGDEVGRSFETFMLCLIVANVVALILETVGWMHERYRTLFFAFEVLSIAIFSAEYVLRLWSVTADARYRHPLWGRLRFMATPGAIIDLLAILPFYLPFIDADLRILRALRLMRLVRVFKLGRYSRAMNIMAAVLRSRRAELGATLFVLVLLLIVSSSIMYYLENEAQPDKFTSIPAAMWWAVATLTTIGYGDMYPITPLGQFIGSFVAILGIGVFALPTGILGSAFLEQLQKRDQTETATPTPPTVCPHCGKEIPAET